MDQRRARRVRFPSLAELQLLVIVAFGALANFRLSSAFQFSAPFCRTWNRPRLVISSAVTGAKQGAATSGAFHPMPRTESITTGRRDTVSTSGWRSACGDGGRSSSNVHGMSAGGFAEGLHSFFGSSSIASVMQAANNVPPFYYFAYLIAAGVGVPVSEDVLLIFVGTLLGRPDFTVRHKVACVAWCYTGVVLSDYVTYGIGAGFRRGLFNPLRRLLLKDLGEEAGTTTVASAPTVRDDNNAVTKERTQQGNTERLLERIRRSGRWVGVAERFALGIRGPMALLCGFTGVPFRSFATGVAIGALFGTVPIQLALGHVLRNRPSAVGGIGAAFVSYYALGPPIVGAAGAVGLWLGQLRADGGEDGGGVAAAAPTS